MSFVKSIKNSYEREHLLLILAEEIDAGSTAKGQAGGEEPGTQMNPEMLHLFREGQHLLLGSLRQGLLER